MPGVYLFCSCWQLVAVTSTVACNRWHSAPLSDISLNAYWVGADTLPCLSQHCFMLLPSINQAVPQIAASTLATPSRPDPGALASHLHPTSVPQPCFQRPVPDGGCWWHSDQGK